MSEDFLRKLPLFADLADQDLDRLYEMAETVNVQRGQVLMREGEMGDCMYVVLEGTFQVTKRSGGQQLIISSCMPGEVVGEMALLDRAPRLATIQAVSAGKLLQISREAFLRLLGSSPTAAESLLKTVMARLRNTEAILMQQEKLASLGTMSAGLAHELNNPASAVVRAADQLRSSLNAWEASIMALQIAGVDQDGMARLTELRSELEAQAAQPPVLDPLERGDRESAISDWLDELGIEGAWELAPVLTQMGWRRERLEEVAAEYPEDSRPAVIAWLGTTAQVLALLEDVATGTERISQIVSAVKTYSHRDQAPIGQVNVQEGIEQTLTMLRFKLRDGITVRKHYAPNLPEIEAYAGDLNQVWTNLIDNAVQAMEGRGTLDITTSDHNNEEVVVEICDSGPGIPSDVLPRIFDVFYTTKPAGEGTGLGLHIVRNIISIKHGGRVQVQSEPGRTCFKITLPKRLPEAAKVQEGTATP